MQFLTSGLVLKLGYGHWHDLLGEREVRELHPALVREGLGCGYGEGVSDVGKTNVIRSTVYTSFCFHNDTVDFSPVLVRAFYKAMPST